MTIFSFSDSSYSLGAALRNSAIYVFPALSLLSFSIVCAVHAPRPHNSSFRRPFGVFDLFGGSPLPSPFVLFVLFALYMSLLLPR
jgi:hypothetical protein